MKMLETLTETEKNHIINGGIEGFFKFLFNDTDAYYNEARTLCLGYYFGHSGFKTVSPAYETLINMTATANELIANIIRNKFNNKWSRVYEALVTNTYNPLNNYEHNETRNGDDTNTITYDTNVENNSDVTSKETTKSGFIVQDNTFGFNSIASVGSSDGSTTEESTVERNPEDNKSHSIQTKLGTDTHSKTATETVSKSGRDKSGSKLITEELKLRNSQTFYDIVYKDIDSITTLAIYI